MKIGVFFIGRPAESGGLYQYSLCILESLRKRNDKIIVFSTGDTGFPRKDYGAFFQSNLFIYLTRIIRSVNTLFGKPKQTKQTPTERTTFTPKNSIKSSLYSRLLNLIVKLNRVSLLIFTAPSDLSFKLKTPYIMPVHDLQHRLNPQFPEVSADGILERREYLYSNAIPHATAILADSEIGREDILSFYSVNREKVKVLPHVPPTYLRNDYTEEERKIIAEKYHLPDRFLFYPANFWRHKNHELMIEALYYIKTHHRLIIPAVFVGSNPVAYGMFENILELIKRYGIEDQTMFPGYIPNEDMGCLYQLADALVMPTYFGPTNLPYLEAFFTGCPVIGSNIRGIREQVGDGGLLVNPDSPEDLADAILKIWNDAMLRETLIQRGYDKAKAWNFDRFSETLNHIIDEVAI
jgi:glycosyltransferase involved in cell wall biosynthesis